MTYAAAPAMWIVGGLSEANTMSRLARQDSPLMTDAEWRKKIQDGITERTGKTCPTLPEPARQRQRRTQRVVVTPYVPADKMECVTRATLTPEVVAPAKKVRKWTHDREGERPRVDGIPGDWLDDDGFVMPIFRERAAEERLRHKREMSRIEEVMVFATSRPNGDE